MIINNNNNNSESNESKEEIISTLIKFYEINNLKFNIKINEKYKFIEKIITIIKTIITNTSTTINITTTTTTTINTTNTNTNTNTHDNTSLTTSITTENNNITPPHENTNNNNTNNNTFISKEDQELLHYCIDCLRICLRDTSDTNLLNSKEFIDILLYLIDISDSNNNTITLINLSTSAFRCLTNLLNQNDKSVEIFLQLNGLTWLLNKLQLECHIIHLFYGIRLLYMLMSQNVKIKRIINLDNPDSLITSTGQPGLKSKSLPQSIYMGTVYESLVTIALSTFRNNSNNIIFPFGGTSLDPSPIYSNLNLHSSSTYSLTRLETIIEIFKIIYVFKATSNDDTASNTFQSIDSIPKSTEFSKFQSLPYLPISMIDYSLHVLLIEIILNSKDEKTKLFLDLQLHSLQLFSVMVPQTETFTLILQQIYQFNPSVEDIQNPEHLANLMRKYLLPLCKSLLKILSIQLVAVSYLFKLPSNERNSIAVKLVPILSVLIHLVSKSALAREIIFSLIMNTSDLTSQPSSSSSSLSTTLSTTEIKLNPSTSNLSPTYATPKEFSLFHKLLSLMTSLEEYSKRYVSEFMFALCDSDANKFVQVTGFGNAVALLQMKNLI